MIYPLRALNRILDCPDSCIWSHLHTDLLSIRILNLQTDILAIWIDHPAILRLLVISLFAIFRLVIFIRHYSVSPLGRMGFLLQLLKIDAQ